VDVLDLFSGIGGFSLGLEQSGMRTVAFCELEPFCNAVLGKHWPDTPILQKHEAGMKYRMASLRARDGIKVADPYSSGGAVSYEDWLQMIPESERILKEADNELTVAQRNMIIRVCCENKMAGGTDSLETLRRGLQCLVKLWKIK
jgi:site-specific DNA-cytosine methylase